MTERIKIGVGGSQTVENSITISYLSMEKNPKFTNRCQGGLTDIFPHAVYSSLLWYS